MTRLFITGGSGLLGSNLSLIAQKKGFDVVASYHSHPITIHNCTTVQIDLTQRSSLEVIKNFNPDGIIHCAAFTNVDECERHQQKAYDHNVLATQYITELADQLNCFLVHISTDAVFDGKKGDYKEDDIPNPISIYGQTKRDAEQKVAHLSKMSAIIRTNFYGWNLVDKMSLSEWMLDTLKKENTLQAFEDFIFTPIVVNVLCEAIIEIFNKKISGILHVAGSETCSKYSFAQKLAEVFSLDPSLIHPISIDDLNLPAPRGKNLSLNITDTQKKIDTTLVDTSQGLQQLKRLKNQGYVTELKSL